MAIKPRFQSEDIAKQELWRAKTLVEIQDSNCSERVPEPVKKEVCMFC